MKTSTRESIMIGSRRVDYRRVRSKTARALRVRVGVNGVEVLQPDTREPKEVTAFLRAHSDWLFGQLDRIERFRGIRKPARSASPEILFRGRPTRVRVEHDPRRRGANRIVAGEDTIVVVCGTRRTPPARSLENWLRQQARAEITRHLTGLAHRLNRVPGRIYVMNQRTKWGNCSAKRNLSFNWRLILAPPFVLHYLVTHEAVHLAVPDHSSRFWLTVQSLCPEAERAKQWLSTQGQSLFKAISVGTAVRGIDRADLMCETKPACFVREQG